MHDSHASLPLANACPLLPLPDVLPFALPLAYTLPYHHLPPMHFPITMTSLVAMPTTFAFQCSPQPVLQEHPSQTWLAGAQ
jgi:hypothetical protein